MRSFSWIGTLLIFVATSSFADLPDFVVEKDVAVPMRDGILLRADLMRPRGGGRFPTLVFRTPYNKEEALKDSTTFRRAVERGYAVLVEDVRGRYASGGEFTAYQSEGRDGYDTIEWAALQSWSNGEVGTFGLSYPGAVQWLAAVENPPHLKAMVPAMTFSTPRQFFYSSGVFDMSWIEWIWNNMAPDVRVKKNLPGPRTYADAVADWKRNREKMLNVLPLDSLQELRQIAPYYYEWLHHPPEDPWWNWAELHDKYDRVHAAVLNLSGWYDEDYGPEGATANFLGLMASRKGEADPRTHLLIGPWVHGAEETGITHSGDREFGPAARIDYDDTVLRWMDHYLRGINNGLEREAPVRLFVMGDNRWREGRTWPPERVQPTPFYMGGSHRNDQPKNRGALTRSAPGEERTTVFTADPAHPVTDPYGGVLGAHDFRELAKRSDVLVFDTEPLVQDLEVTGPITADIYVSCDCRDFDLWVRLLDVLPDGTAYNLMSPGSDVLRASYRNAQHSREMLNPDQIYKMTLPNMRLSNVFKSGHRIRAQISASFFPDFSRNLQSGKLETTSADMRKANIHIHHGRGHASRLVLPVMPR